jgi:ureidoacrylate peracid hydrolase
MLLIFYPQIKAGGTMKQALVDLDAEPNRIVLDLTRTAVIVVDMQNDFGSPGGIFHRAGIDITSIQRVITPTRNALTAARRAGLKIVYLKMGFKPDLSDLGADDSANRTRHLRLGVGQPSVAPDGQEGRFLVRDTWNTDIVAELSPEPADLVLYKHRFSGFYETELDHVLRSLGISNLIFTGCTTSICVESTIRDAMFRDYRCVLLTDCTAEPIGGDLVRSNHEASLLTVQTLLGWLSTSARFVSVIHAANAGAIQGAA